VSQDAVGDPVADGAVSAFVAAMRALSGALPTWEWTDSVDLVCYASGLLLPRFNGLLVLGPGADQGTAAAWLAVLAERGLPFAVLARPAAPSWVAPLAAARDLTTIEQEPFMCLVDPGDLGEPSTSSSGDALTIVVIDPTDNEEVGTGAQLLADGFEAPVELLAWLVAPEVLAVPGMTAYVGRTEGTPCTTGFGAVTEGHVGVFNVATPPAHRHRGFGRAITARAVDDGVRGGAHTAYLQASPMGLGVYERMGFRTVETWACYYPA
jgi:GNAT superfamily N-acetyltransferase